MILDMDRIPAAYNSTCYIMFSPKYISAAVNKIINNVKNVSWYISNYDVVGYELLPGYALIGFSMPVIYGSLSSIINDPEVKLFVHTREYCMTVIKEMSKSKHIAKSENLPQWIDEIYNKMTAGKNSPIYNADSYCCVNSANNLRPVLSETSLSTFVPIYYQHVQKINPSQCVALPNTVNCAINTSGLFSETITQFIH